MAAVVSSLVFGAMLVGLLLSLSSVEKAKKEGRLPHLFRRA